MRDAISIVMAGGLSLSTVFIIDDSHDFLFILNRIQLMIRLNVPCSTVHLVCIKTCPVRRVVVIQYLQISLASLFSSLRLFFDYLAQDFLSVCFLPLKRMNNFRVIHQI